MSAVGAAKTRVGPLVRFAQDGADYAVRAAYPEDADTRRGDARFYAGLRAETVEAFFDSATPDPTAVEAWIARGYMTDDSQINFVVTRADGERIGFFGLLDIERADAEFGRVMRVAEAPRGVMQAAIAATLDWAASALDVRRVRLEVFADNARAIALYERLGFRTVETYPYVRERTRWVRGDGPNARPVLAMERQ